MISPIAWPTYVNCATEEQFLKEKALHDAQMKDPAYISFARFRYTALVAKMHNRWALSVSEYVEFHASIPVGYSVPVPTPLTEEQIQANADAQAARAAANERAKWVREHNPVVETVGDVMRRLQNSPDLRQKYIDANPQLVEQWVLGVVK
jgi:hypothetical protein